MITKFRDWNENIENEINDLESMYFNRDEHIESVKQNFDFRRYHSAEGYNIEINGIHEQCIVQMPSNPLRELNDYRKIHCPMTADVRRGYYVNYEGSVWIIDTNVANVDGAYLSTRMSRCQYLLRWQDKDGSIIERWAYSTDQTKYSNGEYGNDVITVADNQYGLLLPIDEKTKLLKRGMRFAMDFDDAEIPDVYELSNRKIKLNDETYFGRGGTIQIALSIAAFNSDTDKYITLDNGKKAWICGYVDPALLLPNNAQNSSNQSSILLTPKITISGKAELKSGGNYKVITGYFENSTGKTTTDIGYWEVIAIDELLPFLKYVIDGNSLRIKASNDEFTIGGKVRIKFSNGPNTVSTYIDLDIVNSF